MKKEFDAKFRKVGAKINPSYVIPVDKAMIKEEKFNVKKKVKVVIEQ